MPVQLSYYDLTAQGSLMQLGCFGADQSGYYNAVTYVNKYGSGYLYDLYSLSDITGSGIINKITVLFSLRL
ncbi:MAG TPA: hypothetical protein VK469_20075 [Candidatus Kapabacteria bacterium]|nr:hypothetical protein [Candidatus Kapabacteria bacterium]